MSIKPFTPGKPPLCGLQPLDNHQRYELFIARCEDDMFHAYKLEQLNKCISGMAALFASTGDVAYRSARAAMGLKDSLISINNKKTQHRVFWIATAICLLFIIAASFAI